MDIVVAGGTGLIGTKLVGALRQRGHRVVAASLTTGVDLYTADGLEAALDGAETVVDVSNSPYTDYEGALEFFRTSTLNLLTYGAAAGVRHHVVLSVVGTDRLASAGGRYFEAKAEQERLVAESTAPFSIVRATQFFEFVETIADTATSGHVTRVADALVQPIAGDDVAEALASTALSAPTGRMTEIAGPDELRLGDAVDYRFRATRDVRELLPDPEAQYFGTKLKPRDLLPSADATLFRTHFTDWLSQ